jgi:hypothetical protein
MNLDEQAHFIRLDPGGMLERIGELPQQCRAAWELIQGLDLPPAYSAVRHIVVLGMGGSAMGGTLLQGLVAGELFGQHGGDALGLWGGPGTRNPAGGGHDGGKTGRAGAGAKSSAGPF